MVTTTDGAASREGLAAQARQLETLERLSKRFGQTLANAFESGATAGKSLGTTLDKVASTLESVLAKTAGKTVGSLLELGLNTALQTGLQSLQASGSIFNPGGAFASFAQGGVFSGGRIVPFAEGGIVAQPSYFPLGRDLGLAGEAGPEAIMPLTRGPDGKLGVRGGSQPAPNVTVHITATDVESFRRSEAQVAAALARAVSRGRRAL